MVFLEGKKHHDQGGKCADRGVTARLGRLRFCCGGGRSLSCNTEFAGVGSAAQDARPHSRRSGKASAQWARCLGLLPLSPETMVKSLSLWNFHSPVKRKHST